MTNQTGADPLAAILKLNENCIYRLKNIEKYVSNQSSTMNISKNIKYVKIAESYDWFNNVYPKVNLLLTTQLFPALIESMAGSDAICIKGMTNNYTDTSKNLDRQWCHKILPALQQPTLTQKDKNDIKTWVGNYEQLIVLCKDELIPMADRLLGNSAIKQLQLYFQDLNIGQQS